MRSAINYVNDLGMGDKYFDNNNDYQNEMQVINVKNK